MPRHARIAMLMVVLCSLAAISAQAQPTNPSFYGTITRGGRPAPGYQLFVTGPASAGPSVTDGFGRFALFGLPAGRYNCVVRTSGGAVVWSQQVSIPSGAFSIALQ
jgi:hypothetical protein